MIRKIYISILSVFFFVSFTSSSVMAQTPSINLTLSPTFVTLSTDPGESVASQFVITNNSNAKEDLRVDLAKFEVTQGGAGLTLTDLKPEDEFADWIAITPQTFSLAPNQSQNVRFTLSPPNSAALGYYYALVIRRQKEEVATETTVITGAPALPVLLEVRSPNAKKELQLLEFATDRAFYEYLPTNFAVKVKNTGNIHIVPSGNIFIDWGKDKDVALLSANPARGNVLPQSERTFDVLWDDALILREDGKTDIDFDKPLSKFRIGRYTANLLLVYDNGERDIPLEATVSFWVFPWKLVALAILLVMSPFIISRTFRRRKR